MDNLVLLPPQEQALRIEKLRCAMAAAGIEAGVIGSNANLYYLTGRVYSGYMYLPAAGEPFYFVKRPVHLLAERSASIRKPESMPQELKARGIDWPSSAFGLELGRSSYNHAMRQAQAFKLSQPLDINPCLAQARAAKTPAEIALLKKSGLAHEQVYRQIPKLYKPGMTDIELQIEIERAARLAGCIGQFRVAGEDMEIFMGNVLAGDNADAPSPYDFAMGGAGQDPSLPVGADGTLLRPGMAVMVDLNGNFTGYMTDMTRTFCIGEIDEMAKYAHETSIEICRELAKMGKPGVEAKALYEKAVAMADEAGLAKHFMGHRQQAGFVGHGVGIEINELPVIAPRSKDILAVGNAIALEPKFVIPGTGAVGIENTYIVTPDGMECITRAPEEIKALD